MTCKLIPTRCLQGIAIALLISTLGCFSGDRGEVSGVVTVNGDPVEGLEVMFSSEDGTQGTAAGYTKEDGRYVLIQGRGQQGVRIGEYKVTISPAEEMDPATRKALRLPTGVHLVEETKLHETVKPGSNQIDIPLTSP